MKIIGCLGVFSCLIVLVDSTPFTSLLRKRSSSCSGNAIYQATEECYGNLMALTEIPAKTDSELVADVNTMCSSVGPAHTCFNREMRACGEAGITMAQMLRNVFEYVCGEGMDVLMSEGACWGQETLSSDLVKCTENMEEGFNTQGFNGWCGVTNDYIKCIGREIREKTVCTDEAASFMQELFRRSVKPAADMMNCRLHARATRDLLKFFLRR